MLQIENERQQLLERIEMLKEYNRRNEKKKEEKVEARRETNEQKAERLLREK